MSATINTSHVQQLERCTITTELWMLGFLGFALGLLLSTWAYTGAAEAPCNPDRAGTDYGYEVCLNEGGTHAPH